MSTHPCVLTPSALGKIVLARFLELPLPAFKRQVSTLESSPGFTESLPWVDCTLLPGALIADQASLPQSETTLGALHQHERQTRFVYHHPNFAREYRFDEAWLQKKHSAQSALTSALNRMKLINSRNRLTHALVQELLSIQANFLYSGNPLDLIEVSRTALAQRLNQRPGLSTVVDASRLSRLLKHLNWRSADGSALPLHALLPRPSRVHAHWVQHVLQQEKKWLLRGDISSPMSDTAIARHLEQQHGIKICRRSVAALRHKMAIPDWRERKVHKNYLAATEGFSPLLLLTRQTLAGQIPSHPGVYEIRLHAESTPAVELPNASPSTVLYIGSTRDLRKRLTSHQRGVTSNPELARCLRDHAVQIRYRVVFDDWRALERELYRVHCTTFGTPPPCNRMSP